MKGYFNSVEDVYKTRLNHLIAVANRHIYNKDYAIDSVHDAIAKSIEYFNKHPERKVQLEIVEWLVIKSCKKLNKYSREIPRGDAEQVVGEKEFSPERED